jgi:phage shock protein PspC (stress-responsive transcriptional regulator)
MTEQVKKLYRSTKDKVLGGVCGGLGNYLKIDPVLLRVLWAVFFFIGGMGLLAYIIAWIIMPEEPVSAEQ